MNETIFSFTQEVLLKIVNGYIKNRFDFFYLPIDFHTQCNLGYCYINVVDVATVLDLYNSVVDFFTFLRLVSQ